MVEDKDFNPPEINRHIVCISEDYILAAQISACFHTEDTYFAVLEPPRSLHKFWRNEFIKLNNILAKINPDIIIFAHLNTKMINLIKKQLKISEKKYRYINTRTQIRDLISEFGIEFNGIIECPVEREKVSYALLEAKRKKYRLIVNSGAKYEIKIEKSNRHLILSDSSDNILPVILANYAFAINADLQFFKFNLSYNPNEIYNILGETRGSDQRAMLAQEVDQEIKSDINLELKNIHNYKLATFFTFEFPYGYFFPELPTTHIFNKLLVSHFIANAIAEPLNVIQSAVLVDPGFFKNSETDNINDSLSKQGVHIKELREDQFDNTALDNTIQYYPYDFLFICSHGEFPVGTRFKIKFFDKNGCDHIITIDTLDSFKPTNIGTGDDRLINITTFYEFVELDGQPWHNKQYKKGSSNTVVEDFTNLDRKDWIVLNKEKKRMRFLNVFVTRDPIGPYIPMFHSISDPYSTPFIFNNACISTYTLAHNFIAAGCGYYVGTVKTVNDRSAVNFATSYIKYAVDQNLSLLQALWAAHTKSGIPAEDKVYISIGCHFTRFSFNEKVDNREIIKDRIRQNILSRQMRVERSELEKEVKIKHGFAIDFLHQEIQML